MKFDEWLAYGRQSGKDQARFFEYALGSARRARGRYYQGRHTEIS